MGVSEQVVTGAKRGPCPHVLGSGAGALPRRKTADLACGSLSCGGGLFILRAPDLSPSAWILGWTLQFESLSLVAYSLSVRVFL